MNIKPILTMVLISIMLSGCTQPKEELDKVSDIDTTVVKEEAVVKEEDSSNEGYKIGKKEDEYIDFLFLHSNAMLDSIFNYIEVAKEYEYNVELKTKMREAVIDVEIALDNFKDAPEKTEKLEKVHSLYIKAIDEYGEGMMVLSDYIDIDDFVSIKKAEGHFDRGSIYTIKAMEELSDLIKQETGY